MWWLTISMAAQPMVLQIVEDQTGDPIPCATLTTVHQVALTTDDEGLAAFVEPGLAGQDVWFEPAAEGYRMAPDWLGLVGEAVRVREGGFARIAMTPTGPTPPCPSSDHSRRLIDAGVPEAPMRLEVLDRATGRGVPLARIDGGGGSWITDSAGNIAVIDPALYGRQVEFTVSEWHGYGPSAPALATIDEGGHVVFEVDRHWPAERLYRHTGADPFRDTELLGLPTPIPSLQGEVVGLDSNLSVQVEGQTLWLFGDTLRPSYPLGHFDTAAAWVSGDPDLGIQLDYLVGSDGFSRGVADLSDDGPVWLSIPTTVTDQGQEVILAVFGVYEGLAVAQRGFATLDPEQMAFVPVGPLDVEMEFAHQTPIHEAGFVTLREGLRFPDILEQAIDTDAWQVWSPIVNAAVDTHPDGTARWAWRDGVQVPDPGRLDAEQRWVTDPRDPITGDIAQLHYGDVARNDHVGRFVHVFTRQGGDSAWLGELWMSVADTPFGPWTHARKIAAFDSYTIYNPMIHDEFDTSGQHIYVQGTYTDFFSGTPVRTPRYDYNQLMFRLDLDDPRARLPVAYYVDALVSGLHTGPRLPRTAADPVVVFHAYDAPLDDTVPVGRSTAVCAGGAWEAGAAVRDPVLWGEPTERPGLVALWDDGGVLTVEAMPAGTTPLAWVWPVQGATHVPAHDYPVPTWLDAGTDQCVTTSTPEVEVLLSADGSVGDVVWATEGVTVEGRKATIRLGPGDHAVQVTLTSAEGIVVRDNLLLHISLDAGPDDTATPDTGPTASTGTEEPTLDAREERRGASEAPGGCGCAQGPPASPWGPLTRRAARRR